MRYQQLKAFQKHLSSAAPHHLCKLYLVAIADDYERGKALQQILAYLPDSPSRFSGADCDLKEVIDAMQSMSLLGDTVVILDEVEKLGKAQIQTVCNALVHATGFVLLATRSKNAALSEAVEKEGVVLDLLEEKPWDKEKRLAEQLILKAKNAGKNLSPEASSLILERLGPDPALLESEIDKLICYTGERALISIEDILCMTPLSKSSTLWQTAEDAVWEGKAFLSIDSSSFHALVPALRGQLHLGLVLATLIEEKRPSGEWSAYLPKLWPKTLEKRSSQAARLGSAYFRKGLDKLFDIELASRNSSTQFGALLDLFRVSLHVR